LTAVTEDAAVTLLGRLFHAGAAVTRKYATLYCTKVLTPANKNCAPWESIL